MSHDARGIDPAPARKVRGGRRSLTTRRRAIRNGIVVAIFCVLAAGLVILVLRSLNSHSGYSSGGRGRYEFRDP